MPRRDKYHDAVRTALEKEGWTITHDPYYLQVGAVDMNIDLGAEKEVVAAEKDGNYIAVEIKSFVEQSEISVFHKAMGQYDHYMLALEEQEPGRTVFLAVPLATYEDFFQRPFIQKVIKRRSVRLVVYDPDAQTITQWTN